MLTVQEFITNKKPGYLKPDEGVRVIHMHALEVAQHVLKADETQTTWKKDQARKAPERHIEGLRAGMEKRPDIAEFQRYLDNLAPVGRKWVTRNGDNGDIDVERYLDRDREPFDEPIRAKREKPARFIIFDVGVNWGDREEKFMEERHRKIYAEVLQCETENIPCKVIGALQVAFNESRESLRFYFTIKDWTDPIFPGIWGAYSDNKSTNHMTNMVMIKMDLE